MPSGRLPPSSPLSSPTRTTDDLLELTQQMTPSKPPEVLRRLRRDIQSRANNIRDEFSTLKRRLTDLEHQSAATQPKRKTRKGGQRAALADDSIENPQTIEEQTREKGRHFVVQEALFLFDDDVFVVEEDEDFDQNDEFTSNENKIQGQLRRILHFLPDDVKHLRTTELISGAFIDGMSGQRSSTSSQLRGASLAKIVDDVKPFTTSSSRFDAFAALIGYQPGTETREPYYSKLDVPILYDGWQGQKDLTRLFRGPCLLKIHASIIRGPNGAEGLFSGKSKQPSAKTVEKMYKIRWTALGAIVNSSCLAIWLHSADTQLTEIGDETGINYRERHSYYMQCIVEALASKKAWAVDLVAHWDRILFPDADKAHRKDAASAGDTRLEAGEDDDDFFGSAPAVTSPARPALPPNDSPSGRDELPTRRNQRDSPSPTPRPSTSGRNQRRSPSPTRLPPPRPAASNRSSHHDRNSSAVPRRSAHHVPVASSRGNGGHSERQRR
ncbi:hypothetical protein B0H10DRAFT_778561 [Mycena sp. CBHHK59/15]|nr:hypothetical protein B0H10DRAFT_778561 [Mycena sp. CBHHK59/15]